MLMLNKQDSYGMTIIVQVPVQGIFARSVEIITTMLYFIIDNWSGKKKLTKPDFARAFYYGEKNVH
jgi:hypothetical protein